MDTTRQNKISRLIQKELGDVFIHETRNWGITAMVTISVVRISPDLSIANVFLSIFPSEQKTAVLQIVKDNSKKIRGELGSRVRNQLRIIPELIFHVDDSLDYIENLEKLLKSS